MPFALHYKWLRVTDYHTSHLYSTWMYRIQTHGTFSRVSDLWCGWAWACWRAVHCYWSQHPSTSHCAGWPCGSSPCWRDPPRPHQPGLFWSVLPLWGRENERSDNQRWTLLNRLTIYFIIHKTCVLISSFVAATPDNQLIAVVLASSCVTCEQVTEVRKVCEVYLQRGTEYRKYTSSRFKTENTEYEYQVVNKYSCLYLQSSTLECR